MTSEQVLLTAVFSALVSFVAFVFLYRLKREDMRKSRLDASICSQISFAIALLEFDIGLMKCHLEILPQEVVLHPLSELLWATSFSDVEKTFSITWLFLLLCCPTFSTILTASASARTA